MAHSISIRVTVDNATLRGSRHKILGTIVEAAVGLPDALDENGAPRPITTGRIVEKLIDALKKELQIEEMVDGEGKIALATLNPMDPAIGAIGAWVTPDDTASEAEKKREYRALGARIGMHATTHQQQDMEQEQGAAAAGRTASPGGSALYEIADIVATGLNGAGLFSSKLAPLLAKAAVNKTCTLVLVEKEGATQAVFVVGSAASIKTALTQPIGKGKKDEMKLTMKLADMAPVELGMHGILNMTKMEFKQDLLEHVLDFVKKTTTPTIKKMTGTKTVHTIAAALSQETQLYVANDSLTTKARRAKEAYESGNTTDEVQLLLELREALADILASRIILRKLQGGTITAKELGSNGNGNTWAYRAHGGVEKQGNMYIPGEGLQDNRGAVLGRNFNYLRQQISMKPQTTSVFSGIGHSATDGARQREVDLAFMVGATGEIKVGLDQLTRARDEVDKTAFMSITRSDLGLAHAVICDINKVATALARLVHSKTVETEDPTMRASRKKENEKIAVEALLDYARDMFKIGEPTMEIGSKETTIKGAVKGASDKLTDAAKRHREQETRYATAKRDRKNQQWQESLMQSVKGRSKRAAETQGGRQRGGGRGRGERGGRGARVGRGGRGGRGARGRQRGGGGGGGGYQGRPAPVCLKCANEGHKAFECTNNAVKPDGTILTWEECDAVKAQGRAAFVATLQ